MKSLIKITALIMLAFTISCGGSDEKKEKQKVTIGSKKETKTTEKKEADTKTATSNEDESAMDNKGIGPISNVDLEESIDSEMADRGKQVFNNLCTACHKIDKKFVGPAMSGITERRTPEWIMNMIMNPEEMIKKDPIAKKLLIENNMAVMANQNVSEEDTRALLEYFRQIDQE